MRSPLLSAACMTIVAVCFAAVPARSQQSAPVITPLPPDAVTLSSCTWNAKSTTFDADVNVRNHTNLPIAKVRLMLTFVNRQGESVNAYADMVGSSVSLVKGVPMTGRWTHGTFPLSMKTMRCALVGVKFQGYPGVIFSAVK